MKQHGVAALLSLSLSLSSSQPRSGRGSGRGEAAPCTGEDSPPLVSRCLSQRTGERVREEKPPLLVFLAGPGSALGLTAQEHGCVPRQPAPAPPRVAPQVLVPSFVFLSISIGEVDGLVIVARTMEASQGGALPSPALAVTVLPQLPPLVTADATGEGQPANEVDPTDQPEESLHFGPSWARDGGKYSPESRAWGEGPGSARTRTNGSCRGASAEPERRGLTPPGWPSLRRRVAAAPHCGVPCSLWVPGHHFGKTEWQLTRGCGCRTRRRLE